MEAALAARRALAGALTAEAALAARSALAGTLTAETALASRRALTGSTAIGPISASSRPRITAVVPARIVPRAGRTPGRFARP